MAKLRRERGWTLKELASKLGLSLPHVSALEGGQYTFSAALIVKLARLFQRPTATFLHVDFVSETLSDEWRDLFVLSSERDRIVLLDLARRLTSWSVALDEKKDSRCTDRSGRLISLEGIDGDHLHSLGCSLAVKARGAVVHCPYNYRGTLWNYMIERFAKLDKSKVAHRALERTLLFACERLLRFEESIAPMLREGKTIVAPFFAMASNVYQAAEGVGDRRLIDLVEVLLPKPHAIVILRSDPKRAARKIVPQTPGPGQFYSPYGSAQLATATRLYERDAQEMVWRGVPVHIFEAPDPLPKSVINAIYERVIRRR